MHKNVGLILIFTTIFTIFLNSFTIKAQDTWVKTYGGNPWGGDDAKSIAKTSDGGYIITGRIQSSSNDYDIWTLKLDSKGDTTWSRKFGKEWRDHGIFVKETSDGNYLVYGKYVYAYDEWIGWDYESRILLKYDALGNLIWSDLEAGPGDYCTTSLESGLIFAHNLNEVNLWNKSDNDSLLWETSFEYPINFRHLYISTTDEGYILAGSVILDGIPLRTGMALININSYGDTIWTKTYFDGRALCVQQDFDGGYIVGGWISQDINFDGIILKVDSHGDTVWTKTIPMNWGMLKDVKQTSDSGYIFVGEEINEDIELIKTDKEGIIEWSNSIGGDDVETAYRVEIANDGGYVILGATASFGSGSGDIFLIKTDEFGHVEMPTSISSNSKVVQIFETFDIYPNPANNTSVISFNLAKRNHITVKIYSILGQDLVTLYDGNKDKGDHRLFFNVSRLSSGLYIVQIKANDIISQKKLIVIK